VADAKAGDVVVIGADALGHPVTTDELEPGEWSAQAVLRINPDSPKAGTGAGDRYSAVTTISVPRDEAAREAMEAVRLVPSEVVQEAAFNESPRVRLLEFRSELLSAFHGRDYMVRAGIVVPEGFDERSDDARYPVVVDIPGFGGTHRGAARMGRMIDRVYDGDILWVVPDPSCFRGHSVFADSATNGPWGAMLVEEMMPRIDEEFGGAGPEHRYATGVSSGGWSSLWLQVTYPDQFAGCWSHVPDPVDFRDFQQIDLYRRGENMYVDGEGNERGVARGRNGEVSLTYRDFVARETVLGPGGQIHSFEAVFSPRLENGEPMPIFDRETGAVDTEAVETWKPYDIRLKLEESWQREMRSMAGKIHVYAGEVDTFYLEGAVELLKAMAERMGIDAEIEVIEGMGHSLHREGMMDMLETMKERWEARGGD
ncbi:MAG: alpha/beta hydrolase-fold protein, partial [Phycisphaerales bacterium JB065]